MKISLPLFRFRPRCPPRARARPVLCLALLCLVPFCLQAQAQQSLRLARIPGFPDQMVGAGILEEVYGRLGLRVEFVDVPAKRALLLSSSGRLDGEVHRIIEVEREYPALIALHPPINYIEPAAFTKSLVPAINGWASIRDYDVGIVKGVGSSEAGTQGMKRVQSVADQDTLLKMLGAGRVELAVTDLFSGQVQMKRLNLDARIRPLLPPLQRINIHHYLHQSHRDLVPKVEAVLRALEDSGELKRLRDRLRQKILDDTAAGRFGTPP
jgi:ABC-type amino acid transport substrate-binding protein